MLGTALRTMARRRMMEIETPARQLQDYHVDHGENKLAGFVGDSLEIEDALAKLPLINRKVIRLRLDGYSDQEIAAIFVDYGNNLSKVGIDLEQFHDVLSKLISTGLDPDGESRNEDSICEIQELIREIQNESQEMQQMTKLRVTRIRLDSGEILGM
jgi:hypothetical protein